MVLPGILSIDFLMHLFHLQLYVVRAVSMEALVCGPMFAFASQGALVGTADHVSILNSSLNEFQLPCCHSASCQYHNNKLKNN